MSLESIDQPLAVVKTSDLSDAGFTQGGRDQFVVTIRGYSRLLRDRSVQVAALHTPGELRREVTNEHVQAAAHAIASVYGRPQQPRWALPVQVIEYVLTATAGVGASNVAHGWGILLLVSAATIAVLLLVFRVTKMSQG